MADQDPTEVLDTGRSNSKIDLSADSSSTLSPADAPDDLQIVVAASVLTLRCQVENVYAHAHHGLRQHLLLEVGAGTSQGAIVRHSPLNICLCLDRSGSMEGDALSFAKKACCYVVDLLDSDDNLSVVTFAERGELVFLAHRVADKDQIKQTIERISIGNRTNLFEGLDHAANQIRAGKTSSSINRILLLTDGEPTVGPKDLPSILNLIDVHKKEGISVTSLGFGPDYNEELVAALARRTGGNYYYITRPDNLPAVFEREIDSLMRTVATKIKVRMRLSHGVNVSQVYSNDFIQAGPLLYEANLVDIECGGMLASLWALDISSRPPGIFRLAAAELVYENCATHQKEHAVADAVVEFTRNPRKISMGINHRVQGEIEVYRAAKRLDSAVAAVRNRTADMKTVLGDLERTQRLLVDFGEIEKADQINQAISGYRNGFSLEKSLVGAVMNIEQGRRTSG